MKRSLKLILLVSIASSLAPMASAQSTSTEARLQALEGHGGSIKIRTRSRKSAN